ncbi:hypothetical protein NY588_09525 [Curtobacterium flaccumfaciens pv. beticola]|uniref:hypothetical protein n=1 Tax=Curtobacterium flaccumfaciens TaxID=2035 RepID=UPI00349FB7D5|nr:hypothetical protein [Curtobacterium flaccumfaciens pv. basellae]
MGVRNVTGAAARMASMTVDGYAPGRNALGKCARWVYFALGATPNLTPLPSAIAAWDNAPADRRHAIPAGVPVPADLPVALGPTNGPRWPGDRNWMYGDQVISTGRGVGLDTIVRCTDSLAGGGRIGDMTLRQRAKQTGRNVLGYQTHYGGWDLTTDALTAGDEPAAQKNPSIVIPQEDVMKIITDNKTGQILEKAGGYQVLVSPDEVKALLERPGGIAVEVVHPVTFARLNKHADR